MSVASEQLTYEEPGALLERIAEPRPWAAKNWHPLPKVVADRMARVHNAIRGAQGVQEVLSAALTVNGFNEAFTIQAANLSPALQESLSLALTALIDAADGGMYTAIQVLEFEARMPSVPETVRA